MKMNDAKKTGNKRKSKKNNNFLFGAACLILGLLIVLVFFLVNKDRIFTNLKETDFFGRVFGATPQIIENHESTEKNKTETIPLKNDEVVITIEKENQTAESSTENIEENSKGKTGNSAKSDDENKKTQIKDNIDSSINSPIKSNDSAKNNNSAESKFNSDSNSKTSKDTKIEETAVKQKENSSSSSEGKSVSAKNPQKTSEKKEIVQEKTEQKTVQTYDLQLCFVNIDGDGLVVRKTVKRTVPKNDSPLTTAINLLLQGPDVTKSAEKNCISVIPKGTKLLSAKVQNGIAYLNFNDALEFNEYGVEGMIHSLEQIVYTATFFSTVKGVQFMIEGQKHDYLGSEGQWIGSPLSRDNFN